MELKRLPRARGDRPPGENVLDLFGGSGSTLIAQAERPRDVTPEGADGTEGVAPLGAADPTIPRAGTRRRREEIPT